MSQYVWGDSETQFFFHLNPDTVLDAIEALGLKTTGRCLTLNSMENRVYEIEIDTPLISTQSPSDNFVIAKFYRPGRWSKEQILEEHEFLKDLKEAEIPVIAPHEFDGGTLFKLKDHELYYTLFPKRGGRAPEEMNEEQLQIMGRLLARIHNIGAQKEAKSRIHINPTTFGEQNLKFLLDGKFIPAHFEHSYKESVETLCQLIHPLFKDIKTHRIHGDCHKGNIILRDDNPFFIDFDDMLMGPAVQDVWLVVPGTDQESIIDRNILLEAYDSMRSFDYQSLKLIEPLRALRYIHFSAWIAKRWEDPAFKQAFAHFDNDSYWSTQIADLQTQINLIRGAQTPSPWDYEY
ncbi:serine/threonine protein kinase [Bacteriovorax sp. DB6_IX]|uniref:serine/threonine protein kinase n=1 Tax=Bacteriovorax sp. DB6_IX TaxID=1353530 RepID=UPI00038A49E3|nr:serine/threonine protein kinase [Bacteriovorax sp. DB6_IX]EQC51649.1 phosphotransferase enzyme family protein [Bacteriovorax sp. DB6_IX]